MPHSTLPPMLLPLFLLALTSCSYNPFVGNNETTGSPVAAVVGTGIGAYGVSLLTNSRPLIVLGGLTGGMIGYYVTTLTYDAGGVTKGGGKVYKVGDFVGIYIPSDRLFEPHSSEFLPEATPILDSAAAVLRRYPDNNIVISGNTSGFMNERREHALSQARARKVAAYFWTAGINNFRGNKTTTRSLTYVGYGDYYPISNTYTSKGILQNSRIQITSYPADCDLHIRSGYAVFKDIGSLKDEGNTETTVNRCYEAADGRRECFNDD